MLEMAFLLAVFCDVEVGKEVYGIKEYRCKTCTNMIK